MLQQMDEQLEAEKLDAEDDRGHVEKAKAEQYPNIVAATLAETHNKPEIVDSGVSSNVGVVVQSSEENQNQEETPQLA